SRARPHPQRHCQLPEDSAQAPMSVPVAEPGVMIALEINTCSAGVALAALTDAGLVEMRLLKVVGPSISRTTAVVALPSSAASRSGHGRAARGGCGRFAGRIAGGAGGRDLDAGSAAARLHFLDAGGTGAGAGGGPAGDRPAAPGSGV